MVQKQRPPNRRFERSLAAEGFEWVGGLDEVGRGAWAGPVSVGVVVLPEGRSAPRGIRDSKLLTEERREELFPKITQWCAAWAVGHATPVECDRLGMTAALRLAARRALSELAPMPQVVAMDGSFDYVSDPSADTDATGDETGAGTDGSDPRLPEVTLPKVHTVVKGDRTCVSIAAASIVAKVTRDRLMRSMSESFPAFDFDRNKGYPSPAHRTALAGFGLTSLHRRSWAFVDELAFR
jgi:ribonuclease HII